MLFSYFRRIFPLSKIIVSTRFREFFAIHFRHFQAVLAQEELVTTQLKVTVAQDWRSQPHVINIATFGIVIIVTCSITEKMIQ